MSGEAGLAQARGAKQALQRVLAGRSDVRGVGIAPVDGGYDLTVNLAGPDGAPVPSAVHGVPVRVRIVGRVRAQA